MALLKRKLPILAVLFVLAGCNLPAAAGLLPLGATPSPFHPVIGSQAGSAVRIWFSPALPAAFREQVMLPEGYEGVEDESQADLRIAVGEGEEISRWSYALAAPFPTLVDEVNLADLREVWEGDPYDSLDGAPLLMSPETEAAFTVLWGEPASGAVQVEDANQLLGAAWEKQPSWTLVPFEELQPKWKVIAVDDQSPIWKSFGIEDYALTVPIGISGEEEVVEEFLERAGVPSSNRDESKLTTVILTGVTALVRSTAWEMNRKGITYPADDIGPVLREADITHVSNEVPFYDLCPPPDPVQRGLKFCSDPRHFELLQAVGIDVVELTGDHFNDYGQEAMLYTLDLYKENNLPYYGGGLNLEEGRQAQTFEHNGNRIAFIGCNAKHGYATASETLAGAVQCDYDWLQDEVARLAAEGWLVIATFQHNEVYTFIPQPNITQDFVPIAEAGAAIVSGSQAHQSHGVEFFDDDSLITYGLGNLFFDQRGVVEYGDRALIARHVFYDGRYVSTELLTIRFVDYAKPRFMTPEERRDFLTLIFDASIWH